MSEFSAVESNQIEAARRALPPVTNVEMAQSMIPRTEDDDDPDPYGVLQEIEHHFHTDILPTRWKSRPDDNRWVKRTIARGRKARVNALWFSGKTISEIATELECAEITIYKDIQAVEKEWQESYLGITEKIASKNIARLENMFSRLIKVADEPNTSTTNVIKAISSAVVVIQEMNNILGVRQGVQVDIEQMVREVAEANGYDPEKAVQFAQRITVSMK